MYSLATCPTCVRAREELRQKGIAFEDRVVDDRPDYQAEVLRLSGQRSVPLFLKGDRIVVGFYGERG